MELGLLKPYMVWFFGPNSIMALRLDCLGKGIIQGLHGARVEDLLGFRQGVLTMPHITTLRRYKYTHQIQINTPAHIMTLGSRIRSPVQEHSLITDLRRSGKEEKQTRPQQLQWWLRAESVFPSSFCLQPAPGMGPHLL